MIEDADKMDPALLRVIRALARGDAVHDLDAMRRDQECETAARRSTRSFTQTDVRRAVAAVEASGKSVGAIDFPPSGGFRIVIGEPMPTAARNEWDDVLQETPEQLWSAGNEFTSRTAQSQSGRVALTDIGDRSPLSFSDQRLSRA